MECPLQVFMNHVNYEVCSEDLMIKKKIIRARGEENPVDCFLLLFPEFVFNLWRSPVHAAQFLENRREHHGNKTRLLTFL